MAVEVVVRLDGCAHFGVFDGVGSVIAMRAGWALLPILLVVNERAGADALAVCCSMGRIETCCSSDCDFKGDCRSRIICVDFAL